MKLKLTLAIVVSVLAFGSVAAEALPIHHQSHGRRQIARLGHRHHGQREMAGHEPAQADGLRGLVARAASEAGVPYGLANAVVTIESRYNPRVSNGGALGLMQIKAQTARGLGFRGAAASLLDPGVNVRYGMAYLALAYRQSGGNLCATVMRYQSGTGATRMTKANRAYCSRASLLMSRL